MLASNGKSSYTLSSGGTYTTGTPIDINPESIGNAESSYRFVEPIGGGGDPITDYVSKANGGTFQNLIMYPSALSITGNYDIVYKKWVDDAISTAIGGGGTVDYSLARPYFSVANPTTSPLSYSSSTGVFILNRYLSKYVNDTGYITTYTVTESDVTAHEAALTIDASQVTGLSTALSTNFNTLFDARFAISSLASLGTRTHKSLTSLPGSSEGYHLSLTDYTIATQAADSTHSGYLTSADWNKFNNASSGSDSLFELVGEAPNQYVRCNYALTSLYDITAFATSQYVPYTIWDYMPVASSSTLGGIKIGSGLEISGDGTLSTTSSSVGTGNNNIYHIRLNSGATVTQRLIGLTGDIDYPASWTLVADNNALVIVHNLNTIVSIVKIFSKNGVTSDLIELQGNIAYSTFTNKYSYGYNSIKLDNLATVSTELYLRIII